MSEASRTRYLHVTNRLQELAAKHGQPEAANLPAWLDHRPDSAEEWASWRTAVGLPEPDAVQAPQPFAGEPPPPEPPEPERPVTRPAARPAARPGPSPTHIHHV